MTDEVAWQELVGALPSRAARATESASARRLEAALEASYALADELGHTHLAQLHALLSDQVEVAPRAELTVLPWLRLVDLRLAPHGSIERTCEALDAALRGAAPWTRWLVNAESARLLAPLLRAEGAWRRLATHPPIRAPEPWQDQGPMVIHAVLVGLHLAAETGRWDEQDARVRDARRRWPDRRHPPALRVELLAADHEVRRGRYARALTTLAGLEELVHGDLKLSLLCIRLHAQVASASSYQHELADSRPDRPRPPELVMAIDRTLDSIAVMLQRPGADDAASDHRLPASERAAIVARCGALEQHLQAGRAPDRRAILLDLHGHGHPDADDLSGLLAREHEVRGLPGGHERIRALSALREATQDLVCRNPTSSEEEWILLRLLWCRLVVDLADIDRFEDCQEILGDVIDDAGRLGMPRSTMAALDQRAVLLAHPHPRWQPDWRAAVADAGRAANIAVQLIAENVGTSGSASAEDAASHLVMARALLRSLLPVLDRAITLLADGAMALLRGASSDRGRRWDPSLHDRWGRFGRAIHDYAEQAQFLSLEESRRAHVTGITVPNRFHLVSLADVAGNEDPIRAIQQCLGPRDVILQYHVAGPVLVIFLIGRASFDWTLVATRDAVLDGGEPLAPLAHGALVQLVERCRSWIEANHVQGPDRSSVEALRRMLLPATIEEALARARPRHVRVVPHDVLYRVPFGRLRWGEHELTLAEHMTTSLHPTAHLAADGTGLARKTIRGRRRLGHVIGRGMENRSQEHRAIHGAIGWPPATTIVRMDTTEEGGTADLAQHLRHMDVIHFTCHGQRVSRSGKASMALGPARRGAESRLTVGQISAMNLQRCRLVILHSCWTGWHEHDRTNPVHGFPQALCEAGAGAVIAPLISLPTHMAPIITDVLYRMLRFLPGERALGAALDILRRHGEVLVADDPEAARQLRAFGPVDLVEFRYTGSTGIWVAGGFAARLIGRFSAWRWLLWLRMSRGRRARALSNEAV
jgi:hypothetical protein